MFNWFKKKLSSNPPVKPEPDPLANIGPNEWSGVALSYLDGRLSDIYSIPSSQRVLDGYFKQIENTIAWAETINHPRLKKEVFDWIKYFTRKAEDGQRYLKKSQKRADALAALKEYKQSIK